MDPVRLIKQDHRHLKGLFRKFERTDRRSEKQKLGEQIIEELSVHAALEEQLVYPAMRERASRSEEAVLNALEEHHAVKLVLLELDKMKVDEERYDAKMHFVQEAVESHIEEEESRLLPLLDANFDSDERRAMADAMVSMKRTAPNHPHPGAPDTPPALSFAAVMAKLSDVGKDLVRKVADEDKAAGHRRVRRRADASMRMRRGRKRGAATRRRARSSRAGRSKTSSARRGAAKGAARSRRASTGRSARASTRQRTRRSASSTRRGARASAVKRARRSGSAATRRGSRQRTR